VKQSVADRLFKRPHMLSNRRLADAERLGGGGKSAVLSDGVEGSQLRKIHRRISIVK
jgi:hypothetical protein